MKEFRPLAVVCDQEPADVYLLSHRLGYQLIGFDHVFHTDIEPEDIVMEKEPASSPSSSRDSESPEDSAHVQEGRSNRIGDDDEKAAEVEESDSGESSDGEEEEEEDASPEDVDPDSATPAMLSETTVTKDVCSAPEMRKELNTADDPDEVLVCSSAPLPASPTQRDYVSEDPMMVSSASVADPIQEDVQSPVGNCPLASSLDVDGASNADRRQADPSDVEEPVKVVEEVVGDVREPVEAVAPQHVETIVEDVECTAVDPMPIDDRHREVIVVPEEAEGDVRKKTTEDV